LSTKIIEKLVERYKSKPKSEWDEAQVRTSLINPFWQALGWQIDNPKQVEVEKRIHMSERTKFADYAFIEGKKIHFIVEAKSPAHNLMKDKDAIFQTKRYVWNTPETYLGILQDFEEFLPIIVLKTPDIKLPRVGLLKSHYMKYTEYAARWDELVELYSREAVLGGSIEKLLPTGTKLERATEPVDRKFFNDLTAWRRDIAKSIAKRNPHITDERINETVNDLLNRLLFLRIIEDRKIEPTEILYSEWKKWQLEQRGSLWAYLLELFADLNPKYNGTLFQRRRDDPLSTIIIDDKPLHELIKNLYYPSPYLFSVLPVEIIGNAYEKYLGSVIRTTPSRIVKLEEKPEVRKAGGVYYTPKYIVEYIVEQTIGRLLDGEPPDTDKSASVPLDKGDKRAKANRGLKPKQVRKLKILDSACGSGSFLIGAYERLEQYYLDYYRKHPKENKGFLVKTPEGKTKLSFKIKKQILMDNLHGVDIDEQAVNITKFSLYVKLMEDEDYMSQNILFGQALLPDLKNNIKCGNSLVGWDILDMEILPDGSERDDILKKINPFDWIKEFPDIFRRRHLKAYHVTWVTHNSRVSECMVEVKAKHGEPVLMNQETQSIVIDAIIEKAEKMNVPIMAFNILHDHVHLVLACEESELEKVVQGLKGYSSYQVGRQDSSRRLKSSVQGGGRQQTLWAKHYNKSFLESEEKFRNALEYVAFNHLKHKEPLNPRLQSWAPVPPDEAFSDKYAIAGGFDAVIGNPPYIRIQTMKETCSEQVAYFKQNYKSAQKGNYDIYVVFVERALQLINEKGRTGYILPHKFFTSKYGEMLRTIISNGKHLSHVVHFGHQQVFQGATTYTCLMFLDRQRKEEFSFVKVRSLEDWQRMVASHSGRRADISDAGGSRRLKSSVQGADLNGGLQSTAIEDGMIELSSITEKEWNFVIGPSGELFKKFSVMPVKLGDVAKIFQGLVTGADKAFIISKPTNIEGELLHPLLKSNKIEPYSIQGISHWIIFPYYIESGKAILIPPKEFKEKFPNAWNSLKSHENLLKNRERGKWHNDRWYAFGRSQNLTEMDKPKLIIQVLSLKPRWIYDDKSLYMTGGGGGPFYGLRPKNSSINIKFLLGLLNSKLFGFFVSIQSTPMRGGYVRYSKQYIENAPIRTINFTNPSDVKKHDRMVSLVTEMLDLHKRLAEAQVNGGLQSTASGKGRRLKSPVQSKLEQVIQKQIEITDKKIDALVYELYGLTEEEIGIVEGEGK